VSDRDTKTKDLLQLELDGRTDLGELPAQVLRVRDWCGEFAGFRETGSEQTGDLLKESFRAQERVVLLRELLDQFLILVQPVSQVSPRNRRHVKPNRYLLLQVIDAHVLELDLFSTVDVGSITEQADRHSWPGDIGQSVRKFHGVSAIKKDYMRYISWTVTMIRTSQCPRNAYLVGGRSF
jgi:hypothetical protein